MAFPPLREASSPSAGSGFPTVTAPVRLLSRSGHKQALAVGVGMTRKAGVSALQVQAAGSRMSELSFAASSSVRRQCSRLITLSVQHGIRQMSPQQTDIGVVLGQPYRSRIPGWPQVHENSPWAFSFQGLVPVSLAGERAHPSLIWLGLFMGCYPLSWSVPIGGFALGANLWLVYSRSTRQPFVIASQTSVAKQLNFLSHCTLLISSCQYNIPTRLTDQASYGHLLLGSYRRELKIMLTSEGLIAALLKGAADDGDEGRQRRGQAIAAIIQGLSIIGQSLQGIGLRQKVEHGLVLRLSLRLQEAVCDAADRGQLHPIIDGGLRFLARPTQRPW